MASPRVRDSVRGGLLVSACSMLFLVNTVMDIRPSSAQYQLDLQPPPLVPQHQDNQGLLTQQELEMLLRQAQLQEDSLALQVRRQREQAVLQNQERELAVYRQELQRQQRERYQEGHFIPPTLQPVQQTQQIPQTFAIDGSTTQQEQVPDIYRTQPLRNQQTQQVSSQQIVVSVERPQLSDNTQQRQREILNHQQPTPQQKTKQNEVANSQQQQQAQEDIEIIPQINHVPQKSAEQNREELREHLQRLVIQNLREKILQEYKERHQANGQPIPQENVGGGQNQEELKKRLDEVLLETLRERIQQVQQEQKQQQQGGQRQQQIKENQEQLQQHLQDMLSQSLKEQSQQQLLQQQIQKLRAQHQESIVQNQGQPEQQNLLQVLVQQALVEQAQKDKRPQQNVQTQGQQSLLQMLAQQTLQEHAQKDAGAGQQKQRQTQDEDQKRRQLQLQRQQQRQQRRQRLERQQEQLQQQLLRGEEDEREERRRQRQQQQQQQQPQEVSNVTRTKPTSVKDLFHTPSCLDGPARCPHPRIQFYLYTRSTQSNPDLLDVTDPNSLTFSHFRAQFPTKVIIHGFGGGRNLAPSTDLRKAYFTRGEYNIIIVDYSTLVVEPCLSQIEWGPRFCAECIAQMITYLARHPRGTAPDNLHLLGYSVGAHIAGLVANYLPQGKLGRITGLDPTIIFYMGSNRSRDLDPSDAHFVDVIHTGAGILGQWGPNGHVDFYVNGGTSQPGCQHGSLLKTLSCDHTKVTPYYIESINSKAGFWASPCTSQVLFFLGFCTPRDEDYILMGEDVPRSAKGLYYLTTNARKPYAKGFPGRRKPILRGNT